MTHGFYTYPKEVMKLFTFANEFYHMNALEDLLGRHTIEEKNRNIKRMVFLLAVYQARVHGVEYEYLFNLWAVICFDTIETNVDILTGKTLISNRRWKEANVRVFDADLNSLQELNFKHEVFTQAPSKPMKITETRKFKEVCDEANGFVLLFTDDNLLTIVSKHLNTYYYRRYMKIAESCELARSFTHSHYDEIYCVYRKVFISIFQDINYKKILFVQRLI